MSCVSSIQKPNADAKAAAAKDPKEAAILVYLREKGRKKMELKRAAQKRAKEESKKGGSK
jgi:hypothetical protein